MKFKNVFLFTILSSFLFLSFTSNSNFRINGGAEVSNVDSDLEAKKAVLIDYYSNLIEKEIDKKFAESENGEINEKEMIANLVLLTEYGCAYSGGGCSGHAVCGVSKLWAETFGSSSWSGEGGGGCEPVNHQ